MKFTLTFLRYTSVAESAVGSQARVWPDAVMQPSPSQRPETITPHYCQCELFKIPTLRVTRRQPAAHFLYVTDGPSISRSGLLGTKLLFESDHHGFGTTLTVKRS